MKAITKKKPKESSKDSSRPVKPGTKRPFWEIALEESAKVSAEIWERLPHDGAEQHDHYLYGSPKRAE